MDGPATAGSARAAPAPARREQLPALTGSRFLAAFAVVLYHFGHRLGVPGPWLRLADGPAAVAFFFVLSGFVLTYNYERWFRTRVEPASYRRFLRLRLARVYPMHVAALLLATPLTVWAFVRHRELVDQLVEAPMTAARLAASWAANLTLVMVYLPWPSYIMPWNPPAWSIAAELFFYLLLPFLLLGLGRLATRRALLAAIGVLYAGQLASLVVGARLLGLRSGRPHPRYAFNLWLYGMPPFRIWEFAIGCVLGLIFLRERDRAAATFAGPAARTAVIAASFALVATLLLLPPVEGRHAEWAHMLRYYALFTLPFAAIIYALADGPSAFERVLRAPALVFLGDASYSLYMIHWIALMAWNDVLQWRPPATRALVAALVPLSAAFYVVLEKPARAWLAGARPRATGSEPVARVAAEAR